LDNTIKKANDFVEKTSWSTEDIVKIFGENPWESMTTRWLPSKGSKIPDF
jgi:hypothetical protein